MIESIQEKRERLEKEIAFAQDQLSQNIDDFSLIKALVPGNSLLPIAKNLFDPPSEIVNTVDSISKIALSESSWVRRILKIYKSIISGLRIIQSE